MPLTTYPFEEYSPTFSPDGSQVAFVWQGPKGDNVDIYVKVVGEDEPVRLTKDPLLDDCARMVAGRAVDRLSSPSHTGAVAQRIRGE